MDLCKLQALATSSPHTSTSPVARSTRDDSSGSNATTVQALSTRHPAVITLTLTNHQTGCTFDQAVRQHFLRCHVRVRSGFLCGGLGPYSQPSWRTRHPYCGCLAGTHGCDLVSRVRLDQSANPVVVWLGLVSRVVRSTWSRGAFVHQCLYSHTRLRHGRLATHPPRPHRHSSDFDVHRHLTSTLRSWWICCHAVMVVLTASVARHHRLLTLPSHYAQTSHCLRVFRGGYALETVTARICWRQAAESRRTSRSPTLPTLEVWRLSLMACLCLGGGGPCWPSTPRK